MWTLIALVCGLGLGFVGTYAHIAWRRRKAISEAIRAADALDKTLQTLRNITQLQKIGHAHKLARRTLNEIDED